MNQNHGADGWYQPGDPGQADDLTGARHTTFDNAGAGPQSDHPPAADDSTRLHPPREHGQWQGDPWRPSAPAYDQGWQPHPAGEPHPDQAWGPQGQSHEQPHQPPYGPGFDPNQVDHTRYATPHGQQPPPQAAMPPQPVGPAMPSAGYPMSQSSAGYPMSQSSAGYPMSQSSAGYPMSQSSAGYPMSQSSAGYPMSQSSAGYPMSQTSAPYPVSQASAYEPEGGHQKAFPLKWLAAGAIVLALITGVVLFAASELRRPVAPPAPMTLAQKQAPPGWRPDFAWSTLLPQVPNGFAVSDNRIIYVDAKGSLTVLDAETGKVLMQPAQPRFTSQAKVMVADLQGTPTIVVSDAEGLYLWPANSTSATEPKVLTLSASAKSFPQGGGLLVLVPGRQQWVVTGASQLKPVDLPADHFALGASPDGFLVAASQTQGRWTYLPSDEGQAPREVKPEKAPDGTVGEVHIARLSGGVVAAWGDTADANRKTVGLYDANTGRLVASAGVDAALVKDLTLTVAPGGKLASAGPLLARLSDGKTEIAERWTPRASDETHLWASKDGVNHVWNGEGQPTALDARMLVPWGVTKSGTAIVMETVENNQVVLGALKKA